MHLEEVRFFDLFGYSEEAGTWQCFMCNNPEKATGECSAFVPDGLRAVAGLRRVEDAAWLCAGMVTVAEAMQKVQQSSQHSTDNVYFNWNSPLNSFCLSISGEIVKHKPYLVYAYGDTIRN